MAIFSAQWQLGSVKGTSLSVNAGERYSQE